MFCRAQILTVRRKNYKGCQRSNVRNKADEKKVASLEKGWDWYQDTHVGSTGWSDKL